MPNTALTEHWETQAECLNLDGDWWFPTGSPKKAEQKIAIETCNRCPVRRQCAQNVLNSLDTSYPTKMGIWAGIRLSDTHSGIGRTAALTRAYQSLKAIADGEDQ